MRERVPQYTYLTPEQCVEVELMGFSINTIRARIKRGMSYEEAVNKPIERLSLTDEEREAAKENGVPMTNVYGRVKAGWTVKEAITIPVNAHRILTEEDIKTLEKNGISKQSFYNRFYRLGWEFEDCITIPVNKKYSPKKGN